jgi:hypothetical protein
MRPVTLSVIQGGIQRLREKGNANPNSLYDLVNGHVTLDQHIRSRPGTFRVASVPGTMGLVSFNGLLHVFAAEPVDVPPGFVCNVLIHPAADATPIPLSRIHFAAPFMGALYVVAEFDFDPNAPLDIDDGGFAGEDDPEDAKKRQRIYHFWLRGQGQSWKPNYEYSFNQLVEPKPPNGYYYAASRAGAANPAWGPGQPRDVGDLVEPTVYNEYFYEVTFVSGSNAASGRDEPDWPLVSGGQVTENVIGSEGQDASQPPSPTTQIDPRYA